MKFTPAQKAFIVHAVEAARYEIAFIMLTLAEEPQNVRRFADLHSFCDANTLGDTENHAAWNAAFDCDTEGEPILGPAALAGMEAMQLSLDAWLEAVGRHLQFMGEDLQRRTGAADVSSTYLYACAVRIYADEVKTAHEPKARR